MLLGLFFTVMLIFWFPPVLRFMHVRWAERYTAKEIFTYMWKIISHIGSLWNIIKESQKSNQYNGTLYYDFDSDESDSISL